MRYRALVRNKHSEYRKIILFETDHGTYLFPFRSQLDPQGCGDEWFPTIAEARQAAFAEFGIHPKEWMGIPDPEPGFHDWDNLIGPPPISRPTDDSPRGYSLPSVSSEVRQKVFDLLRHGLNISAIKLYREEMNVGLMEAKYCVERLIEELPRFRNTS